MLLTFAPNSTLFTSLPLTIGLKCGLLRLTILLGMLSLLSLFRKWFFCWRYILVMISRSLFSLTVNKFSAFSWPLSISRISFSILPSRSSSLRVIFLVWLLLCLRCFLYVRFAFCTSRNFVQGRWIPSLLLNSLVVDVAVQLFHQFRAAESSVHLQEHQGHFPFRREERFASQLRPHAFPYQTEVLCHLAERKQFCILPNSLFSKVE